MLLERAPDGELDPRERSAGGSQVCVALAVLHGTESGHRRSRLGHAVALPEVRVGVQIQQGLEGPGRSRTDRHPRACQTLRRRDDRRHDKRWRVHAQDPPPTHPRHAMTIRVLIADDQSMVRAGFRMLLAGEQDMEVVAEASNGLGAVAKAAQLHPTVILVDIRMPELDGLQATRRIIATDNTAWILILTTFGLDVYEALSAGASGFVLKDDPPG